MNPSRTMREHLRDRLREAQGGPSIRRIADEAIRDPQTFDALRALTRDPERTVAWRALWTCAKISEQDAERFADRTDELVGELLRCRHDGSKRLLLSILFRTRLGHLSVALLDRCLELLASPDEAIAVRALAVKLAFRLCTFEPELQRELRLLLEEIDPEQCPAALRSTIRQTLRRI